MNCRDARRAPAPRHPCPADGCAGGGGSRADRLESYRDPLLVAGVVAAIANVVVAPGAVCVAVWMAGASWSRALLIAGAAGAGALLGPPVLAVLGALLGGVVVGGLTLATTGVSQTFAFATVVALAIGAVGGAVVGVVVCAPVAALGAAWIDLEFAKRSGANISTIRARASEHEFVLARACTNCADVRSAPLRE